MIKVRESTVAKSEPLSAYAHLAAAGLALWVVLQWITMLG